MLEEALRREDVLDLARADAERERAERAVRRRVAVAADDGHAGLGQPELGADDVDDALLVRVGPVERDAVLLAVLGERAELLLGLLVDDREAARERRDRVIHRRERAIRRGGRRARVRVSPAKACGEVTSWTRWRST